MKVFFSWIVILLVLAAPVHAQSNCYTHEYEQRAIAADASLQSRMTQIEGFVKRQVANKQSILAQRGEGSLVVEIPVVVHILYHAAHENVTDAQVANQIEALNLCFRRLSADTANTPAGFKSLAADCRIEFKLATSDARRRNTTGIIRKYTPVLQWNADDNVKYSSQTGDDAWDANQFLNIWVCNLRFVSGYSSLQGGPLEKDGVVINAGAFGYAGAGTGHEQGKTAVHEVGHWLGLKHIWGDSYCGDDGIADTPTQSNFTSGCPSGTRASCDNNPNGSMYMNYMDLTADLCMNLFTNDQSDRMLAQFASGGPRYSMLSSVGLLPPLIFETPVPEEQAKWSEARLYPNPASTEIFLDLSYDIRWLGKVIMITNVQGIIVQRATVSAKIQQVDISRLVPGLYFLSAKREDGTIFKQKFIKN